MKGFDVLKVKSAVKSHNKFDLSRTHLTTMEFGEIMPLLADEVVPGDNFNISGNFFARLAPLVRPTYGKFSFKTVYAYVPYHMVAADADAWFAGKTSWEGYTPVNRYITMINFHSFLKGVCFTSTGATSANSVYTYTDSSGNVVYNIYTPVGKYYVKVLNALGYALPSGVDERTSSGWWSNVSSKELSLYPLLAYFKLYNDYMSQSQRFNTSTLSNLLNAVKYGKVAASYWNNATGAFLPGALSLMFSQLLLNYENDYFTSAWQSPNTPLSATESINGMDIPGLTSPQVTTIQSVATANQLRTRTGTTVTDVKSSLSQRALDFLKSFDDWVRRNNYSGSRDVQQVYSRFGIKTSDFRDHYANVITTDVIPIQVGDVTATYGDIAQNTTLGDYSGKGIMNGGKSVSIKCDDFGLILVLGYFTVTPMNAFGFDRKVLRVDPLDYYNPEFDGLGADEISVGEYFSDPTSTASGVYDSSVFGYTERYNSYRYGRDQITGEFRDYSSSGDMTCWHTGRNLSAVRDAGHLLAQDSSVNTMPQINSEYNRIFSVTYAGVDHFYVTAQFSVDAIRPMLNLNQVADLGQGDTVVPRNGNVIS